MNFVIRRNEDNAFVAKPGGIHSYTKYLQSAQVFASREAAEANACGNERVVTVIDAIKES